MELWYSMCLSLIRVGRMHLRQIGTLYAWNEWKIKRITLLLTFMLSVILSTNTETTMYDIQIGRVMLWHVCSDRVKNIITIKQKRFLLSRIMSLFSQACLTYYRIANSGLLMSLMMTIWVRIKKLYLWNPVVVIERSLYGM